MTGSTVVVARLAMGLVFIVASAAKITQPSAFAAIIREHGISRPVAPVLAVLVIAAEFALGMSHLLGRLMTAAVAGAIALLLVFLGIVVNDLIHGRETPCGCFSPSDREPVSARTVVRLGTLIVVELLLLPSAISAPDSWEMSTSIGRAPSLIVGQALMSLTIAIWLYQSRDLMVALRARGSVSDSKGASR